MFDFTHFTSAPGRTSDDVMELRRRLASFSIAEAIGSQETQND
jgi:hypothetical protein